MCSVFFEDVLSAGNFSSSQSEGNGIFFINTRIFGYPDYLFTLSRQLKKLKKKRMKV